MDTQLLKYIHDIAAYGSINRAAQINFISPSHLSRQLKKMEEELSIVIFERSSFGMQLTKQGYEFMRFVESILGSVRSFEERYHYGSPPQDIFSFRIAMHHNSMANQAVVNLVNRQMDCCEFLDVVVDSYNSVEETLNAMHSHRYTLGVIQYSNTNAAKVEALLRGEQLGQVVVNATCPHVLLSPRHPLAGHSELTEGDLAGYARIYFINEDLSNFKDFTALNTFDFQSVKKRILIKERGQLFHYLRSMETYYIGTRLCSSCSECDGLVEIPLRVEDDTAILTAAVFTSGARKDPHVRRYIELLQEVAENG